MIVAIPLGYLLMKAFKVQELHAAEDIGRALLGKLGLRG